MDRLRAITVFVRIVETGSLTAAAAALSMSAPAVVRCLATLEVELGARLLNRTTRRIALTDEGREYLEHCKRILAAVQAADAALSSRRDEPQGRLRVTAPVMYGRLHVAPLVNAFLRRHPRMEVELLLLDRVVDMVEEGIDVAVRIAQLPDSSLVAQRVGEVRRVLCASPDYLAVHGTPALPAGLAGHRCIMFTGLGGERVWEFGERPKTRVDVHPVLRTNQIDVAAAACEEGIGCGRFLSYQVEAAIAAGRLVRLLGGFEPAPVPVQIVYPHSRLMSANVRAFVELALARLRAES